ncbi:MAG: sialidase family protein [Acidobacteria bacterium]|nr:sialidase family protein [Acidobacteriota bacterium]
MFATSPRPARGCPSLFPTPLSPLRSLVLATAAATAVAAGGCGSGALQSADPVRVTNPKAIGKTQLVSERVPIGIAEDYKPCIARLPDGELLLVAFHAPRKGGVPEEYAFLYRSGDGGRNWSRRRRLEVLGREPYLSVTSDGTVFLSTHLLPKARGNREGYTQSFLYRSTDGGDRWEGQRIGFQDLEGMEGPGTVVTGRNVLELESGELVFAVAGKGGHEFLWRSSDGGETWDQSRACRFGGVDQSTLPFPILGEAFLWQAPNGDLLAICRITPKYYPPLPGTEIPAETIDHFERMVLYRSQDGGRQWSLEEFGSHYGEMYPALMRLRDSRLLFTFTMRAAVPPNIPPLGVRAVLGREVAEGFQFDFRNDRIVLDAKNPVGMLSGGGFGPTVQVEDGTLVTSTSYRTPDEKTHLEIVRWRLPETGN